MVVLYYTQTYFLDAAIETIRSLQEPSLELHLMIEITPDSKHSNIIHVNNLDKAAALSNLRTFLGEKKALAFEPYFKSVKSVHFLVFKRSSVLKRNTIYVLVHFLKLLYKIKPSVIHFDTITLRSLLFIPFITGVKKVITIHDPIPHLGDYSWKQSLTKNIYNKLAHKFVFYSKYAKSQFKQYYPYLKQPKYLIAFQPFTFNQLFEKSDLVESCILFFGRISYYKGIDLLMKAIPEVLKIYPHQIFVIAGRTDGYQLDYQFLKKYEHNILLLNRYINTNEAVRLIQKSKFLVCPYRDASQSGVLMTARAIGKPVIATNVGAFTEYIQDGVDGLIANPTCESLVEKILFFLNQNCYKDFEKCVEKNFSTHVAKDNQKTLLDAYSFN